MTACTIIRAEKACSGKCRSSACADDGRLWLAAACGGMTALYRKEKGFLVPATEPVIFSSTEDFRDAIASAIDAHRLSQLVIIGAENDIGWVHAALPAELAKYVAAEIKYPLLPLWFGGKTGHPMLQQALQHAMG